MKIKKQLIVVLSSLVIILVLCLSIKLISKYAVKKYTSEVNRIYGTVLSYNNGLLNVKTLDDDKITVISSDEYDEGDFVLIEYYKVGKDNLTSIELLADGNEINKISSFETTTITTTETTTTTTKKTTSKVKKTTTTEAVTSSTTIYVEDKDNIAITEISDIEDKANELDKDSKDDKKTAKTYLINLIDFVFYDSELNGVKFSDLTSSAKEKVLYCILVIDNKLDTLYPDYKDSIEDNYEDAKEKLVAKYLDIASTICNDNSKQCDLVKEDFNTLKTSINISWDFIKTSIQYGLDISTNALKNWYEVWSGK